MGLLFFSFLWRRPNSLSDTNALYKTRWHVVLFTFTETFHKTYRDRPWQEALIFRMGAIIAWLIQG